MNGDVIRFVALDLVLRIILVSMMDIAFVVYVFDVNLHDRAADPASL
jgi:hypothetical protein